MKDQAALDNLREVAEILQQPKRDPSAYLVSLSVAREIIDRLIERRLRGDGDSRIALEACCSKDVYLDARAVERRIGRRRRAMEDKDGQVCQVSISCVVKSDLVLRQSQLVRDPNHCADGAHLRVVRR